MRKISEYWLVAVLVAAAGLSALAGCQKPAGTPVGDGVGIRHFTDTNGCQYLLYLNGGITPRLRPDGKQECGQ